MTDFTRWQIEGFIAMNCEHKNTECRMMRSCGQIKYQCLDCGQPTTGALKHDSFAPDQIAAMPDFDEDLRESYWKRRNEIRKLEAQQIVDEMRAKHAERKSFYLAYLKSPEWRSKRELVIEREKGICEGCRKARIAEVHHLSYDHLGDELLYELRGLCIACHKKAHGIEL